MAKNCSALPLNFTLVSCGPRNSSRDQCLSWGCCWNSSLASENTTQCYQGIANNQTSNNSTHTTSVPMTTTKNPNTEEFISTTAG